MKTIIEPFRIKSVEPIRRTTAAERERLLKKSGYNLFALHSADVTIDLLTDSGTGAMSAKQWAGMMEGDESYAGSPSFYRFEKTFKDLTGFKHIIPTHQGRACEKILFAVAAEAGDKVLNNTHFDTTRANVEYRGAEAVDLFVPEAKEFAVEHPFKGNMDLAKLRAVLSGPDRAKVPLVMMTVTNNSWGGQPVSLRNIREASALCRKFKVPFFLDACRFAENAYFIKLREPGQALACELYAAGGIRGVEIGTLMFGRTDPVTGRQKCAEQELVRLAIPRRTYTQSHIDFVVEVILGVWKNRRKIRGLKLVSEPPMLRHFTARLARA